MQMIEIISHAETGESGTVAGACVEQQTSVVSSQTEDLAAQGHLMKNLSMANKSFKFKV